jgi:hypothetical protein
MRAGLKLRDPIRLGVVLVRRLFVERARRNAEDDLRDDRQSHEDALHERKVAPAFRLQCKVLTISTRARMLGSGLIASTYRPWMREVLTFDNHT